MNSTNRGYQNIIKLSDRTPFEVYLITRKGIFYSNRTKRMNKGFRLFKECTKLYNKADELESVLSRKYNTSKGNLYNIKLTIKESNSLNSINRRCIHKLKQLNELSELVLNLYDVNLNLYIKERIREEKELFTYSLSLVKKAHIKL